MAGVGSPLASEKASTTSRSTSADSLGTARQSPAGKGGADCEVATSLGRQPQEHADAEHHRGVGLGSVQLWHAGAGGTLRQPAALAASASASASAADVLLPPGLFLDPVSPWGLGAPPGLGCGYHYADGYDDGYVSSPLSASAPPWTPPADARAAAAAAASAFGGVPGVPSAGSQKHDIGKCKPCVFVHKGGCGNGVLCSFCHLCPADEKQRRRKVLNARRRQRLAAACAAA